MRPHPLFTKARFFCRCTQAVAAIEAALIAPLVLLMGIGIFDFGEAFFTEMQIQHAAQAGAQYAMAHGFDATSVSAAVTAATNFTSVSAVPAPNQFCGCATNLGVGQTSCTSTCSDGSAPGTYVTVSATGSYETMIPYPIIPTSFLFSAQSTVRIQ
jgi:Flp pilus assembly protein TadG